MVGKLSYEWESTARKSGLGFCEKWVQAKKKDELTSGADVDAFASLSQHRESDRKLGCLLSKAVSIRVYHLAHLDPARRKSRTLEPVFFPRAFSFFFFEGPFFGLTFPMRSFVGGTVTGRCLHAGSCVLGA